MKFPVAAVAVALLFVMSACDADNSSVPIPSNSGLSILPKYCSDLAKKAPGCAPSLAIETPITLSPGVTLTVGHPERVVATEECACTKGLVLTRFPLTAVNASAKDYDFRALDFEAIVHGKTLVKVTDPGLKAFSMFHSDDLALHPVTGALMAGATFNGYVAFPTDSATINFRIAKDWVIPAVEYRVGG